VYSVLAVLEEGQWAWRVPLTSSELPSMFEVCEQVVEPELTARLQAPKASVESTAAFA
jgi:hypothetical protein